MCVYISVGVYFFLLLLPPSLISAADWMASPMVLLFCTPDVKISSVTNNTVLSRTPETNELPLPSHTETPRFPDFETRWLKIEAKVVHNSYVCFHAPVTINSFADVSLGSLSHAALSYVIVEDLPNGNFVKNVC